MARVMQWYSVILFCTSGSPVLCSLLYSPCVYWNGEMQKKHEEELRALEVNSSM